MGGIRKNMHGILQNLDSSNTKCNVWCSPEHSLHCDIIYADERDGKRMFDIERLQYAVDQEFGHGKAKTLQVSPAYEAPPPNVRYPLSSMMNPTLTYPLRVIYRVNEYQ